MLVIDLWQTLVQLADLLLRLAGDLLLFVLYWSLLIAWVAWWLLGVDWRRAWPVLAGGAWAPLTLLLVTGALVWSQLAPSTCTCLGFMAVPNFWWQLGGVGLLAALTLFCGWLQGVMQWYPAEVPIEPPAVHGGHEAGAHH